MPDARSGVPTAQDARYWCGLLGGSWLKAVAFRVTVDSGQLRVYGQAGPQEFLPLSGGLVLFDSTNLEHEVLPTKRERTCLIGWFHTPTELNKM